MRIHDVPVVFTVVAHTNAPYLGYGAESQSIRVIKTRHEETAIAAASAYTRVSGRLGVASVVRGPGFANPVNALLAAAHCHSPMLLPVSESSGPGEASADIPQAEYARLMGVDFIRQRVPRIWSACLGGPSVPRNGRTPQILSIADGILDAEVSLAEHRAQSSHQPQTMWMTLPSLPRSSV